MSDLLPSQLDSLRPCARRKHLLVAELDGELLIYHEDRQLACRLNRAAAQVFQLADGEHSIDELAALVSPGPVERELVLLALDELQEAGLLEEGYPEREGEDRELSRRRFMQRLGVAGAAAAVVPVVEAFLMPTAAHAASGLRTTSRPTTGPPVP